MKTEAYKNPIVMGLSFVIMGVILLSLSSFKYPRLFPEGIYYAGELSFARFWYWTGIVLVILGCLAAISYFGKKSLKA